MTMDTYKKKYKEALERARVWKDKSGMPKDKQGILDDIFPELAESEDEKIRKSLIILLQHFCKGYRVPGLEFPVSYKDMLAWLEKQEGCEHIRKEWLEHIKQSWYKEGFIDGKYSGGTSKEWTINDTTTLNELIDFLENGTAKLQHDLTRYANWLKIQFTPIEKQGEQKFEMKSAEESLGIDSATYNEIVDECIYGEQKPIEWDADDDEKFFFLKARLKDYEDCIIYDEELSMCQKHNVRETTKEFLEWLDSIKERMGG